MHPLLLHPPAMRMFQTFKCISKDTRREEIGKEGQGERSEEQGESERSEEPHVYPMWKFFFTDGSN